MSATLNERRTIACPRCGSAVRIPLFWIAGIEGIFRCKSCGLAFKTGYKAGAALSATGLVLSLCTVQLYRVRRRMRRNTDNEQRAA